MSLKNYLARMKQPERDAFAARVVTTYGHLRNIGYGVSPCAPKLAVRISRETAGAVTRQMLCPDDYWQIWPDLQPPSGGVVERVAPVERSAARSRGELSRPSMAGV